MGYYTSHHLEVKNVKSEDERRLLTKKMVKMGIIGYALCDEGRSGYDCKTHEAYYGCLDCCKWYGHNEDMLEVSKSFPNMVFKLSGNGDDSEDMWFTLYQNGQMEECYAHIVYDEPKRIRWDDLECAGFSETSVEA